MPRDPGRPVRAKVGDPVPAGAVNKINTNGGKRPGCAPGTCTICDTRRLLPHQGDLRDEHKTPHRETRVALTVERWGNGRRKSRSYTLPLTEAGELVGIAYANPTITSVTIEWENQVNTYRFFRPTSETPCLSI